MLPYVIEGQHVDVGFSTSTLLASVLANSNNKPQTEDDDEAEGEAKTSCCYNPEIRGW